jgi:hypothetical protein
MSTAIYTGVTVPRGSKEEGEWMPAKRFQKYVYSTSKNGCLIHKVNSVRLRWWDYNFHCLMRRQSPHVLATTTCGINFFIDGTKAKTCEIPNPDAVLCASCHGEGRNFPRGKEHKISKELAKIRKGCIERIE